MLKNCGCVYLTSSASMPISFSFCSRKIRVSSFALSWFRLRRSSIWSPSLAKLVSSC